ncbi:hypothetical protein ACROYT_G009203 [Oculina patagonica]
MKNHAVFRLVLVVGIFAGAVRIGHAKCKDRRDELQTELKRLKEEFAALRKNVKEKEEINQLTKVDLLKTIAGGISNITYLKTDVENVQDKAENFCLSCQEEKTKCPNILSLINGRIEVLTKAVDKLHEYKEKLSSETESGKEESGYLEPMIYATSPLEYTGIFL